MYEFGAQQVMGIIDPTDLTEDLGNDHIKAGNLGISNLKILVKNLLDWTMEKGERYDHTETIYKEVTRQYTRYIGHVISYLGGIEFREIRQGDGKSVARAYIGKDKQKASMQWLLNQARNYDAWLSPASLLNKLELDMNTNDKLRSTIVSALFNGGILYRIKEGGMIDPVRNYPLDTYLADLTNALFISPVAGKLSEAEQKLQGAAIAVMMNASGLNKNEVKKTSLSDENGLQQIADSPLCCGYQHADTGFTRINMGASALSKSELGAIMLGRLQRVLAKYKAYRATATGSTRDYYNYQIFLIERLLSN